MEGEALMAQVQESPVSGNGHAFYAYELHDPGEMKLTVAAHERDWMAATDRRFAYRCLPMLMANSAGWVISSPSSFSVWWDGGGGKESLSIYFPNGAQADSRIVSHFGSGILTFTLPYLFRTPAGTNLWVKGPSNSPKDGIQALEGIVESDWASATFTMNWRLTRMNHVVRFDQGEPICMLVPVTRGLADKLTPIQLPLTANCEVGSEYEKWNRQRSEFLVKLSSQHADALRAGWEKDYFKGLDVNGRRFPDHQSMNHLQEFKRTNMDKPYVRRNFLDSSECATLIQTIERYADRNGGLTANRQTAERTEVAARFLQSHGLTEDARLLASIRDRCETEVNAIFARGSRLYPEFTLLQGNYPGDCHTRHADNARFEASLNKWVPNHTPQRAVSACLYLNNSGLEFEGGHLVFPALEYDVSPESGLFVAFNSDERFEHEVTQIASGKRYSLLIWFTCDPAFAEGPLISASENDALNH